MLLERETAPLKSARMQLQTSEIDIGQKTISVLEQLFLALRDVHITERI
jgi:hypothetical protein